MFLKLSNLTLWGYGLQSPLKKYVLTDITSLKFTKFIYILAYHIVDIHLPIESNTAEKDLTPMVK